LHTLEPSVIRRLRPNQRLQLTLQPLGDRPLAVLRGVLLARG
jgi:hypothetical protein